MREKLIELLSVNACPNAICNFCEHFKNSHACEKHKKEVIANHLIANGVTVPDTNVGKWIPVSERLPENNAWVLVCKRELRTGLYIMAIDRCELTVGGNRMWLNDYATWKMEVTHWMPLPEPPKEGK